MGGKILGMAKIKLQNNKVILKSNKASCSCCVSCNEPFNIGGRNVFEITKQKYNQYFNGGTWNISTAINFNYSSIYQKNISGIPTTQSATASAQLTFTRIRSGCVHYISVNIPGQYQVNFSSSSYSDSFSGGTSYKLDFVIYLKENNGRYYVKYVANTPFPIGMLIPIFPLGTERGFDSEEVYNGKYPVQVQATVDGNNLSLYKIGREEYWILRHPPTPSIPWDVWNETSSATLNATFTPA